MAGFPGHFGDLAAVGSELTRDLGEGPSEWAGMSDFKILIERLTDEKTPFAFSAGVDWWRARAPVEEGAEASEIRPEDPALMKLDKPFEFALEVARVGDHVRIEGSVSGQVGLECSRCGKRYPHALRDAYRLVLEPMSVQENARESGQEDLDPEAERGLAENGLCLGEELEAGRYRGPILRLDDFFGEVISLAMPLQPLCEDDCPGVCPHCGVDRRESADGCGCEDEKIESPFAVLASLKTTTALDE